jgi:hypothetical protein
MKLVGADDWRGETDELKDNAKGPPRPQEVPLPFTSAAPREFLSCKRKAQPRLKSVSIGTRITNRPIRGTQPKPRVEPSTNTGVEGTD